MTGDTKPLHLVERAAARLQSMGGAGLAALPQAREVSAAPTPQLAPPPASAPAAAAPAAPLQASATAKVSMQMLERAGLVVGGAVRTRIIDEYRVTAASLLRSLRAAPPGKNPRNMMLVTSASPAEGKSFCSINLAGSLARSGLASVVVVDVDPKVNSMSTMLGLGNSLGLFDLARDASLQPEALLVPTEIPDLLLLPIGRAGPEDVGSGVTKAVAATLERLARKHPDWVIVLDAAPCLATSDPSALASAVTQVALIVEAGRTQRAEVETAIGLLQVCPAISLVLNKAVTAPHTFGSYGYYNET